MRMKSFPFPLMIVFSFAALLFLYPEESCSGAKAGLIICFDLIIPSLFPFFVLSSLLVSFGFATLMGNCLTKVMWPLFRLNGSCAAALILGSVGGYPVGARTVAQLYEEKQYTSQDAIHLSTFCNNCGPAFLFSVAGVGVFSSKSVGFLLLGTHLAASFLVGFLFRFYPIPRAKKENDLHNSMNQIPSFSSAFPDCVRDSFASTLNVCAFVILFSVLLRLATCSGLLSWTAEHLSQLLPSVFSPTLCYSLIAGTFEVSTGIYSLSEVSTSPVALPLAAFMLGWGGLSVHCQSLQFLNRCVTSLVPYFLGKLMQGLFAAVLTALLASYVVTIPIPTNISVETFSIGGSTLQLIQQELFALWLVSGVYFLLHWKKGLEKHRHLLYNKGRK